MRSTSGPLVPYGETLAHNVDSLLATKLQKICKFRTEYLQVQELPEHEDTLEAYPRRARCPVRQAMSATPVVTLQRARLGRHDTLAPMLTHTAPTWSR